MEGHNRNVVVVVLEGKQQKRGGDGKEQTCFGGSDGGNNKKGEEIKETGVKKNNFVQCQKGLVWLRTLAEITERELELEEFGGQ